MNLYFLVGAFFFTVTLSVAQQDKVLNEKDKVIIFQSILKDGANITTFDNIEEMEISLKRDFLDIEILTTFDFIFLHPYSNDSIYLSLFKIINHHSPGFDWYLLRYYNEFENIWLRLKGYHENDFKLFIDNLFQKRNKKKEINKFLKKLESSNSLYLGINFECLVDGYLNGTPNSSCYYSNYLLNQNEFCINFDLIENGKATCNFSKIPLIGQFRNKKIYNLKK